MRKFQYFYVAADILNKMVFFSCISRQSEQNNNFLMLYKLNKLAVSFMLWSTNEQNGSFSHGVGYKMKKIQHSHIVVYKMNKMAFFSYCGL